MPNERITENLVRNILKKKGYYNDEKIRVEEQKTEIISLNKLLKNASKSGKSNKGYPEFIITTENTPDFVIIFECKPENKFHQSKNLDKPKIYAEDGVIHYAKFLSKNFNVIAVAVSGQNKNGLKVSNFIWPKNSSTFKNLENRHKQKLKDILPIEDYIEHGTFDHEVASKRHDDLMQFSRELHNFMRDNAKLTEAEKPLLVSGTLIALKNENFSKNYHNFKIENLQKEWMKAIKTEFKKAKIPHSKEYSMTQPYSSIAVHPNLARSNKQFPWGVLFELVRLLNEKVWPFISVYHDFDVVGRFYGEFLKYTGGDKKALGIVLTPRHITELFSLIANVQKNSKVLDPCAGTGGFLISAMHQMFKKASTSSEKNLIKSKGLVGVEDQPHMYALAASNMILRGDGKANLIQGDSFNKSVIKKLKEHKCNIGMLNPPFAQKDKDLNELFFVENMLDCLEKGGLGVAIVPMRCAITPHSKKEEILKNHTLEAVMSMPDDLFYPVGVVCCIMVFRAKIPHEISDTKTWFGYWKNDGFVKTKMNGRIDLHKRWSSIKDSWIKAYKNKDDVPGECIKQKVSYEDEWCPEAYMQTDYDKLKKSDFEKVVREYSIFKLLNE